jgi:hypothetical protein
MEEQTLGLGAYDMGAENEEAAWVSDDDCDEKVAQKRIPTKGLSEIRELETCTLGRNITLAKERTISSQDIRNTQDIRDVEALIRSRFSFLGFVC